MTAGCCMSSIRAIDPTLKPRVAAGSRMATEFIAVDVIDTEIATERIPAVYVVVDTYDVDTKTGNDALWGEMGNSNTRSARAHVAG